MTGEIVATRTNGFIVSGRKGETWKVLEGKQMVVNQGQYFVDSRGVWWMATHRGWKAMKEEPCRVCGVPTKMFRLCKDCSEASR